ncbi:nucleoside/nucleotide kinase family protein [Microlunatus parietis]|uniref:Uridine kinase n=1 Tax=Microlunatus parietis TaxID=682979 RepID=A0A7Y9I9E9_9ACTN|nr:uridine kinase [Microlunatus parietis]NYE72458.1 uridine kinase [Microlunatus parietis]
MDVLETLAVRIRALTGPRSLVAVDGPDAAGKTTLADDLADLLGSAVTRLSVDDFHHPAERRRARGLTPESYLEDSFDVAALAASLRGFAAGDPSVVVGIRDLDTDQPRRTELKVPPRSVLIVDGVFLLRPELAPFWDLACYLHVPERVTLQRALRRDLDRFGDAAEVERRYRLKYLPGQALYRARHDPLAGADLVIDTAEPHRPKIIRTRDG